MPRALTDNGRVELRLRPEDKATLTRAASLKRLDLTGYILGKVLPQAEADIAEAERLTLSERNSLRVLALLENPPAAPDRFWCAPSKGRQITLPTRIDWNEAPIGSAHGDSMRRLRPSTSTLHRLRSSEFHERRRRKMLCRPRATERRRACLGFYRRRCPASLEYRRMRARPQEVRAFDCRSYGLSGRAVERGSRPLDRALLLRDSQSR